MNFNFGCQNARSSSNRRGSIDHKANKSVTWVAGLMALVCGLGVSVHAQTASYSGSTSSFDTTNFTNPQGIATDAAGDVFIANNASPSTVYEFTRTAPGVYSAPVALPNPSPNYVMIRGIVIDSAGNLWVADNANGSGGQVYESVNTAGSFGTPSKVGTGWTAPWGMAADALGDVFVADNGANAIVEISGGTPTTLNTGGISAPRGIALDSSANIFAINGNNFTMMELTAASSYVTATTVNSSPFSAPGDIAIDASGNIWVADFGTNTVREMTFASNYQTVMNWGAGLNGPVAVWLDADGNWLVTNFNDNAVRQIATGAVNFGTVAIGSTSTAQTLAFTFTGASNTTINAPKVVTRGAAALDFADAGGGTCTTTHGAGHPYAPGATCTVNVNLKPRFAGPRYGAVQLVNTSGTVLASALIYGTGSGPEAVFSSNQGVTTLGGGFTEPFGVALDGSGNVYIADRAGNAVKEIPVGCADSSCVVTLGAGFSNPAGVAVDGNGTVYVADSGSSAVKAMPANCNQLSCVSTLGGGFTTPYGVAVDGKGNVFVADNADAVKEIPAGCGGSTCVVTLGGGFASPTGIAVDGSGNIYVAGSGAVKEMPPGCNSSSCVTPLGGTFNVPIGLAVDAGGNIYVGDLGTNQVDEMPAGCASASCVTTLGTGFSNPAGVKLDGYGNLYVADKGNQAVRELNLFNPPSLSFATTNMGSESSDSPKIVTVSNVGNAALTFPVPATGQNPSVSANFTLDGSTTCPVVLSSGTTGSLAGGASCALAVDFIPATTGSITGSVVLRNNDYNLTPSYTQTILLSGSGGTAIVPNIQVNNGAWQQVSSVTVNSGDTVNLAGQNISGGTWSWTGPNTFTASTRVINAVPLPSGTNIYTLTYTNSKGVNSTQQFTITVNGTALTPYIQVNSGAWQQASSVAVNLGDKVNLALQNINGGSWSWTGSSSTSREADNVSITSATNTFVATYTNTSGVQSTQTFTITVNPTAVVPYMQVNNGAWQQISTVTVNVGDTVNMAGQNVSTGTWSWSGLSSATTRSISVNSFSSASNVYNLTYTNSANVPSSPQAFTVNVNSTAVVPYIQVNNGAWQQVSTVTVNLGDTVNMAGQNVSTGTWSWSGLSSATTRAITVNSFSSASNVYNLTYTNTAGVASSPQAFTVNVNPTAVVPYMQVNNGPWQQVSTVTVNLGDTVNMAGQNVSTGTWSWSGLSTATTRAITVNSFSSPSNVYNLTYTNTANVASSPQAFTVNVNPTAVVPWIQVNNGPWQQTTSVAVNVGDTVNLAGQNVNTGTWSWTETGSGYTASTRLVSNVPITSATNVFNLTYTNTANVASSPQAFTITVNPTPLTPYIQVNNGAWQQLSSVAVNVGDKVNLALQNINGGTWSWSGSSSTSREADNVPITSSSNVFVATYTNADGVNSTMTFTITVNPTPFQPFMQVNGGPWQQTASATVNSGDTVNLAGQNISGGSWSWSGPNGFQASGRLLSSAPLPSSGNAAEFILTYTNVDNVNSTQTFTINVN